MKHFIVSTIGTGTIADPFRPNIPDDVLWVGNPHTDGTFLVAVPDESPITPSQGRTPVPDAQLDAEANRRGQRPADVRRWRVASRTAIPEAGSTTPRGR